MPSDATLDLWLRTALDAADAAARVHVERAHRVGATDGRLKGRADFVSEVDEEAQRVVIELIRSRHPDHLILAEEDDAPPALPTDETPIWVVDPLDGTTNFLHGHPAHAASVAVAVEGRPVAGAVVSGPSGERWWARLGGGAWQGDRPIRVGETAEMERALIGTGFPFKDPSDLPVFLEGLGRVLREAAGVRRAGAAAIDLAYVADGRFDAFWEYRLNPWDFAAGILLITEAGGVVERLGGGEVTLEGGSVLAASSAPLLDALRALVLGR
ncbi:MAG: inositol monophosphatase [Gemmatimonadetes bacterium]|nr:inositol monophosphatase [Gemmatimonadota bacterium]MBT8402433.1 inositol monophosphatase [Gemmatimonadota bacterium]NNF38770.1 inositol monophosphatase [Gemmatimonadota bacterium]